MKFRLKSQHHIEDRLLEPGTEIVAAVREGRKVTKMGKIIFPPTVDRGMLVPGKEIETSWSGPPSIDMDGLDPEGEKAVAARVASYMSVNDLPISPSEKRNNAA